uniref:Uncharacterized protein n=1 Tax=Cannabis sativa TaxID=3483 RepID=A0A803PAD5_CANSA
MVNTIINPIAPSPSLSLPLDPQIADLDTWVPVKTGIPMNAADMVSRVTTIGTTSLAITAGQLDVSISVDLSGMPMPPTTDPPLAPPSEGRTQGRQPPRTTTGPQIQFYAGETGPNQSAFHMGHLIYDDILMAQEVYHSIKSTKKGKIGWMAVKLDLAKTLERVEWRFSN